MMLRKETLNSVYIGDGISYICRFKRLCNEKIEQYFARVIFVVVKTNFQNTSEVSHSIVASRVDERYEPSKQMF